MGLRGKEGKIKEKGTGIGRLCSFNNIQSSKREDRGLSLVTRYFIRFPHVGLCVFSISTWQDEGRCTLLVARFHYVRVKFNTPFNSNLCVLDNDLILTHCSSSTTLTNALPFLLPPQLWAALVN